MSCYVCGEDSADIRSKSGNCYCTKCANIIEYLDFSGPGDTISQEQLPYQRARNNVTPAAAAGDSNQFVYADGDIEREYGESPNNMTASTKRDADGPEQSRARTKIRASAYRGKTPKDKYITGYSGDGLDYGATHSESFTGTGAIAISPMPYDTVGDEEDEEDEPANKKRKGNISESPMKKKLLREWEPSFAGGDYSPGEHKMPSPGGNGVAARKPKKETTGSFDTNTKNIGKPWPRKHNETAAMCDVDENGVENKPQGVHKSSVGKPEDGHQTPVSHDWPDEPKNSGGIHEPFGGSRWGNSGTLGGGSDVSEGLWSPDLFASLMESAPSAPTLFNHYIRSTSEICFEDFQKLCHSYGCRERVNKNDFIRMLESNSDFMFCENEDAGGQYWSSVPMTNDVGANVADGMDAGMDAGMGAADAIDSMNVGDDVGGMTPSSIDIHIDLDSGSTSVEMDNDIEPVAPAVPSGPVDDFEAGDEEVEDDYESYEDEGEFDDFEDSDDFDEDEEEEDFEDEDDFEEEDEFEVDEDEEDEEPYSESLNKFLASAKSILNKSTHGNKEVIGEALAQSWKYYSGNRGLKRAPLGAKKAVKELASRYNRFRAVVEGVEQSPHLPKTDSEMKDEGKSWPRKHKTQKSPEDTPIIPGTDKGMSGKSVKENIAKLTHYLKRTIRENARGLKGKHDICYSCIVNEDGKLKRTPVRATLAEIAADAEELLQFHKPSRVTLEAYYGKNGSCLRKRNIALVPVKLRSPLTEGKTALFRFARSAEKFSSRVMREGLTCKIENHRWGKAVKIIG